MSNQEVGSSSIDQARVDMPAMIGYHNVRSARHGGALLTIVFDLDGVVYRGETAVPGALAALNLLQDAGHGLRYLTNNSTRSREHYGRKLTALGIPTAPEQVMTSAHATALYLAERGAAGKTVFVVGEHGLAEEMESVGLRVLSLESPERADFVVVGLDRQLTYAKIARGYREIARGAEFVATNRDPTFPMEGGVEVPGGGAMVAAIAVAVGREPFLVGKPKTYALERLLSLTGATAADAVMVGDRTDTDILVGRRLGLPTVLTLTGVTSREQALAAPEEQRPDYIVETLEELPAVLQSLGWSLPADKVTR
jgi:phosphoglycolate/pyridoxal phosphate phosphatase family enzyme